MLMPSTRASKTVYTGITMSLSAGPVPDCPPVNGPRDLPDLRVWVMDRWRPGDLFHQTALIQKMKENGNMTQARSEGEWAYTTLEKAQLWWVTEEACDVLANAAPTWNGELGNEMIPGSDESEIPGDEVGRLKGRVPTSGFAGESQGHAKGRAGKRVKQTKKQRAAPAQETTAAPRGHSCGFAIFERGLSAHDSHSDRPIVVSALCWGPVHLAPDPTRTSPGWTDGIGISSYAWMGDLLPEDEQPATPMLVCIGRSDWPIGDLPDRPISVTASEHQVVSMAEDRRLLAALWALPQARGVAELARTDVDRAARRRSTRLGLDPDVRVVTLRYGASSSSSGELAGEERADVRWRHRWMVTPHFRAQPYGPGRQQRKQILIGPYMKGPEGAPMLGLDRVWRIAPPRSPKTPPSSD